MENLFSVEMLQIFAPAMTIITAVITFGCWFSTKIKTLITNIKTDSAKTTSDISTMLLEEIKTHNTELKELKKEIQRLRAEKKGSK